MRFKTFVESAINCPFCGAKYDDLAWIAWGLCGYADHGSYRPGTAIRWRSDVGSEPRAWTELVPSWLWSDGYSIAGGSVPKNFGDPSTLDILLEDVRFPDGVEPAKCPACAMSFFAGAEIRDGAVVGSFTCPIEDPTVGEVRHMSPDYDKGPCAKSVWHPGIEDEDLVDIDRFIDSCDLAPAPDWPVNQTAPPNWLEDMTRHQDSRQETQARASEIYPGYLVRHALARRLDMDPFYLEEPPWDANN